MPIRGIFIAARVMYGLLYLGLSGCSIVADQVHESMRAPTYEELNIKIHESSCPDLRWNNPTSMLILAQRKQLIRIDRFVSNNKCQVVCTDGYALSNEERTQRCKQNIEIEVAKQKVEKEKRDAEIAQQNALIKAKNDEMYSALAAKGYSKMSIDDFQLDADSLPSGKKIYIDGYYEVFGDIQYLVRRPTSDYPDQYKIPLLTESATRPARKILIEIQQSCAANHGACRITVIGKVTRCQITFLTTSRNKTCIDVDTLFYY